MTTTVTVTVTPSFFEEEGKKEEANLDGDRDRHSSFKEEGKREDANCDRNRDHGHGSGHGLRCLLKEAGKKNRYHDYHLANIATKSQRHPLKPSSCVGPREPRGSLYYNRGYCCSREPEV